MTITNPLTSKPVRGSTEKTITALREGRSRARKDARSGHPGRRAQGQRAIYQAGAAIRQEYVKDVHA